MPYKKNYRRKNYRKKKTYNNRWKTYSRAGNQLYKDVNMLKNLINVEFKSKEADQTPTLVAGSPSIVLLNGLTKGDDINNRDGRQARFKSVQFNGRFSKAGTTLYQRLRIALVVDKQPNETAPLWTDIYRDLDVDCLRNLSYRKRFVILWERTFQVTDNSPVKTFKHYHSIDMKTVYDDSDAGTEADISTNALYLIAFSDATGTMPIFKYDYRLRWIDN